MASGRPEAGQPVGSAGEALTHFRDDTEDVAMLVDGMVDVSGGLVFTVVAGFLLGSADATAAIVLLVPLAGVVLTTRALDGRIKAYRRPTGRPRRPSRVWSAISWPRRRRSRSTTTDGMLARLQGLVDAPPVHGRDRSSTRA